MALCTACRRCGAWERTPVELKVTGWTRRVTTKSYYSSQGKTPLSFVSGFVSSFGYRWRRHCVIAFLAGYSSSCGTAMA